MVYEVKNINYSEDQTANYGMKRCHIEEVWMHIEHNKHNHAYLRSHANMSS